MPHIVPCANPIFELLPIHPVDNSRRWENRLTKATPEAAVYTENLIRRPGAKHANSENLSPKAMDRLDNLASWHLVMPVSMDASL